MATPEPLDHATVKVTLETAPTVRLAAQRLKTSQRRLRALCRGDDTLRPLLHKLADKGRGAAKRGMGRICFTSNPAVR